MGHEGLQAALMQPQRCNFLAPLRPRPHSSSFSSSQKNELKFRPSLAPAGGTRRRRSLLPTRGTANTYTLMVDVLTCALCLHASGSDVLLETHYTHVPAAHATQAPCNPCSPCNLSSPCTHAPMHSPCHHRTLLSAAAHQGRAHRSCRHGHSSSGSWAK